MQHIHLMLSTQGEVQDEVVEEETVETTPKTEEEDAMSEEGGKTTGESEDANEDMGCRVYVGNLAWSVSWQDLKDHMKKHTGAEVVRADVMKSPDGRSKGCGVVEFATVQGAQRAVLTLNDSELHGRQIFVREDRETRRSGGHGHHGSHFSSGENSQSRRVYVGNLSWDVAWQDLKDHMRSAGNIIHAEVITEANGRSKGCGIVEYETEEEAQEAISTLTDTDLKGRMIFVREDRETSSGTFHGAGGGQHRPGTSVYVWNLDFTTSWQSLKDFARQAGNVDQATILTGSDGESIGCGVVVYQRPQEAARAIRELQGQELDGRPISLREDRMQPGGGRGGRGRGYGGRHHYGGRGRGRGGGRGHYSSGGGSSGCQLYVGNLSYDTTWRELKDFFRQCGQVDRVEVMEYPDGKKKGFGTVRFFKEEDAQEAIDRLNGVELQGRDLEVRMDNRA